jgi:hypothetical protein
MKANELRIGNLVCFISDVGPEPEYIETTVSILDIEHAIKQPEFFNGIQLTEERLVRFGFELQVSELFHKKGYDLEFVTDGYVEFYFGEYGGYFIVLQYIHQLQNLYFALTGEELEIL